MKNDNSLLMPQDDSPLRADARRNRQHLLDVAHGLFDTEGVDAVSMTAIAEAAGVGKGTLYRHFTNKADLCNALLDDKMRRLQAHTLNYLRQDVTTLDKLQHVLVEIAGYVIRNKPMLLVESDGRGLELDHQAHYWWRQTIVGLLQQLRPGEDVRYHADVLYAMVDVRMLHFQQTVLGYGEELIFDGLRTTAERLSR